MSDYKFRDNRLYYQDRLYIPDSNELRLYLISQAHTSPAGGHGGRSRTFELLSRYYYCPGLARLVAQFVKNCEKCSRSKASNTRYNGLLHPLPVPTTPWKEVALDFVTGLPQVGEFNAICVVIDRLTKQRHYIPCSDTIDARGMGNLYYTHIFRLHGLPDYVTSDRGTQFVNDF